MPIDINLRIVGAELVRMGLENLSQAIPEIGRKRIYDVMVRARNRLRKPAPRPGYPIRWDSQRQRRYVMALLREQGGPPYRRTGRYVRGWQVVRTGDIGYRLENTWEDAQHVGGDFAGAGQSRIHQSRWPIANDVLADEIDTLPQDIENNIASEARRIFV